MLCLNIILIDIILLCIASTYNYEYICVLTSIRMIATNWIFSIIYVLLSKNKKVNEINGIAQTFGSLIKIIFPVMSTKIFYYSKNNINIIFGMIVLISIIILKLIDYI